jgi:SAM-dependent methyltransferase
MRRLLELNRAGAAKLNARWPYERESFERHYVRRVAEATPPGTRVTDVGAGRRTRFAQALPAGCEIVGVDVLAEDLEANPALTTRVTRDVAAHGLPAEASGSAAVCSQYVLEHIPDLDAFAAAAFDALAPGGSVVQLFSCRRSLFATLNRLLPDSLSRRLLFSLRPESVDVGGFATYYDRTHPSAARAVFERAGFLDVRTETSWETSQYFEWLLPAFVALRLYESAARRLALEDLASYAILTARKPGPRAGHPRLVAVGEAGA